jgi:hypothetical protein
MRTILTTTLCATAILALADGALAQGFQQMPPQPPAVSPYLNLLRGGASRASNYYNLTVPQVQQQYYNEQFYQQGMQQGALIEGLEQQSQAGGAAGPLRLPVTGHTTQLQSQYRYFQTRGAGGAASGVTRAVGVPSYANTVGVQGGGGGTGVRGGTGAGAPPAGGRGVNR